MSGILNSFITYDGLPIKSGGAHHLNSKSPQSIYSSSLNFLSLYAGEITARPSIELSHFKFKDVIKYSLKLGIPHFDLNNSGRRVYWEISNEKVELFINDAFDWDYLRLTIFWKFKFKDVNTGKILPWQDRLPELDFRRHNSQLYLRLSAQQSTMSVWFAFPFSDLTEEKIVYINGIQNSLPFNFSKSSWRLWQLSKNHQWHPQKIKVI